MPEAALRVLLVDDEPRAREVLAYFLGKVGGIQVVGQAGDGPEAARLVGELEPDVVFLDVHMPDMDGVETARLIRQRHADRPQLVFVTAYEQHAVAAFEAEAVDYVVKPLSQARILETVDRLRRRMAAPVRPVVPPPTSPARTRRLPLTVAGPDRAQRTVFLDPAAILVVEAQGKSCVIFARQGRIEVSNSMTNLESLLGAGQFLRVHRSYLVNLRAVSELFTDGRTHLVKLDGVPTPVPVSRDRVAALRSALGLGD